MNRKNILVFPVIIIVILIGGVVLFNHQQKLGSEHKPYVIKIGYIGPLSGPAAVLGQDSATAIQLLIDEANLDHSSDLEIKLIIEDDQYDTARAVSAYHKLIYTDDVDIIFMATYGGIFAVGDQAETDGVVIIDPLDCDDRIANLGENVFCIAKDTDEIGYAIAEYLNNQGIKQASILYSTVDKFMPDVSDAFAQRYLGTVQSESYVSGTTDFSTSLVKLRDTDVLVLLGYDELGHAMKQARDLGVIIPFVGTATFTSPPLYEASNGDADGATFPFWLPENENIKAQEANEKFTSHVGRSTYIPLITYAAYDSTELLTHEVLPRVSATEKPERITQIKNTLLSVENYQGITGNLSMNPNGKISGINLSMHQLQDGNIVPITE